MVRSAAPAQAKKNVPAEWFNKCPFMKKMPPQNPFDSASDHDDRAINYKAVLQVCMLAWTNPGQALATASWMEERIRAKTPVQAVSSDAVFKEAPLTLANVDDDWICSYLVEDAALSWTPALLGKAMAYDPQAHKHVLANLVNCSLTLKLGEACAHKIVLKLALDIRRKELGQERGRLPKGAVPNDMVLPSGQINWGLLGVYEIHLKKRGEESTVVHRPTSEKALLTTVIDSSWWLDFNWSDHRAILMRTAADKHKMHAYFGKGAGPFKKATLNGKSKEWDKIVVAGQQQQEAKESTAKEGLLGKVDSQVHTEANRRKCELTKRAREALTKRLEERAMSRRIMVKTMEGADLAVPVGSASSADVDGFDD